MAEEMAKDPVVKEVILLGLLNQKVVELHARAMKRLAAAAPARAARYRKLFEDAYSKTMFSGGSAGATFDAAPPEDVPYWDLRDAAGPKKEHQSASLGAAMGEATTLSGNAMLPAYRLIAPGGLEEPTFALACAIVRLDLISVGGYLAYSEMDENATIDGREVTDHDIASIEERVDLLYAPVMGAKKAAALRSLMDKAVNKVAMERPYHEVRQYLSDLPAWDGVRRLKYVVRDLLRAEPALEVVRTERAEFSARREAVRERLLRAAGHAQRQTLEMEEERLVIAWKRRVKRMGIARRMIRKFFIAAVARTLNPGCKHDCILILNGAQGRKKSSFFRTVAPCGRFSDDDLELKDKDSKLVLRKSLIFEWSELAAMRSARDWEAVKGFLARQEDTVRPPYAKRAVTRKRHCVFGGTTNEGEFLGDPTGSRRFWVVDVGGAEADLDETARQRDQLWAEALHLHRNGGKWWFEGNDELTRAAANERHAVEDPWTETLERHMANRQVQARRPSTSQILEEALKIEPARATTTESRRVGKLLRKLGYESVPCWNASAGASYKGWVRAGTEPAAADLEPPGGSGTLTDSPTNPVQQQMDPYPDYSC